MPRRWSPLLFPTQHLPRETEDFPRGDMYPKQVRLYTYLTYFLPEVITW